MSAEIKIFDTTLRDGEQSPGCSMNLNEKIEMARQLEKMRVDVIEAGFAIASPGDFESVRTIAETVKNSTVASLARAVKGDIDAAWEAVRVANKPRIHVFLATSPLHMQYKLQMTQDEVIARTAEMVKYAKHYCDDIEFSAEDATRSEKYFLSKVIETAIANGATTVNIPDTVGYATPEEMYALMVHLKQTVKGIDNVDISTHNHNDLGLAVANSLAAIRGGATQVECTINGIGERAGNAALEEIVMALKTRKDCFDAVTNIDATQIYRTSKLLTSVIGVRPAPTKPIVGRNAFAHESGVHQHGVLAHRGTYEIMTPADIGIPSNAMVLGKHSGRHAFVERLKYLGIELSQEKINEVFNKFKELADRKKIVSDRDIEALVGRNSINIEEKYKLKYFAVNSASEVGATATIALEWDGGSRKFAAIGDGQVEAAFSSIDDITGIYPELQEYEIQAVTGGIDAQGEVAVRLRLEDITVIGTGVSLDVIEASIRAYVNGINKLVYEMEKRGTE
ncbi:MAG: 2-isopropylmalate synthase [Bacillota bacterium]|nr:2-isopropylmalate synthase [Bacillota bacterium]